MVKKYILKIEYGSFLDHASGVPVGQDLSIFSFSIYPEPTIKIEGVVS
jgi:hypothetical protein